MPLIRVFIKNPPIGEIYEHILIRTSLKHMREIKIPVRARVLCKWNISDEEFFFGFINKERIYTRSITIQGLKVGEIENVWCNLPKASAHVLPGRHQNEVKVVIKVDLRGIPEGPLEGDVFVKTKDKEQPILRFPLVGIIQDPTHRESCCK